MSLADWFQPARSPDGRIEVVWDPMEVRMSIWLQAPTVVRTSDGAEVAKVDIPWSCGTVSFPQPGCVQLQFHHYPDGRRIYEVVVDVEAETFWFLGRPEEAGSTAHLPEALEQARRQHVAAMTPELVGQGICPECHAPLRGLHCDQCERDWG